MKNLKVGERVKVYTGQYQCPFKGTIIELSSIYNNMLQVKLDKENQNCLVHPQQCRRLKPKPKNSLTWISELWIKTHGGLSTKGGELEQEVALFKPNEPGWKHFVEVEE